MGAYIIKRDNEPAIKFTGEKIAGTLSDQAMREGYRDSVGRRCVELRLYRTKDGKYVCEEIGRSQWRGEDDRHSGAICEDSDCVIEFFGHDWLANVLYASAKFEDSID